MNTFVWLLIGVNVLVSLRGFKDLSFFNRYKFQVGAIKNGQRDRFISSAFLHVDYMHLIFNMYALYLFSGVVTQVAGLFGFLLIYFGSLIAGNLYTLYYHKDNPMYAAVGASGAVSGIVYSAIVIYPNMGLYMIPIPIEIPGYLFGFGYLLYTIYGMKAQLGNIGHSAHLGGALGGFILTLVWLPSLLFTQTKVILLLLIPVVLLFFFGKRNQ